MIQLRESPHKPTQPSSGEASVAEMAPAQSSVVYFRACKSWNQWSSCIPCCRCRCHAVRHLKSSSLWHKTLGALFAGCSGYPLETLAACTERECVSQSRFGIYVCYLFPSWILSKAFMVTIMSVTSGKISASLTVNRVVPFSADAYLIASSASARTENVEDMKALFSSGLASPRDVDQFGGSILRVSLKQPLQNFPQSQIYRLSGQLS